MIGDEDKKMIVTLRRRLLDVTLVLIAALGVGGFFVYHLEHQVTTLQNQARTTSPSAPPKHNTGSTSNTGLSTTTTTTTTPNYATQSQIQCLNTWNTKVRNAALLDGADWSEQLPFVAPTC